MSKKAREDKYGKAKPLTEIVSHIDSDKVEEPGHMLISHYEYRDTGRPRITHVAIKFQGTTYSLPAPNRHHHVIRLIVDTTGVSNVSVYPDEQGFLDETGRFLTRKQALISALQNNQVKDPSKVMLGMLFSEDLW